jgi:hypothetical protein
MESWDETRSFEMWAEAIGIERAMNACPNAPSIRCCRRRRHYHYQ